MNKKKICCAILLCCVFLLSGCRGDTSLEEKEMVREKNRDEAVGEVIQNRVEVGKELVKSYAGKNYSLNELRDAVNRTVMDAYWPNEQMEADKIEEAIGIRPDQYEECFVEYHHLKDNVDQLILVKCKKNEIANIEMIMEDYRAEMISSHRNQNINLAKAEASRMEVIEDYVCFVQLGGDLMDLQNDADAMVAYCQEQNEKAIDILEKMILS